MGQSEEFLTPEQMGERLRIHSGTIRRWIRSGRISSYRVGWLIRVPRSEAERVIAEMTPVAAGHRKDSAA